MVAWIGVDDTDSLQGMCTTFLAAEIVRELTTDYDLVGYPRLVRLNPNVPWKTRGNGAICVRFGHGAGRRTLIGELEGRPIWSHAWARGDDDVWRLRARVSTLVESRSEFQEPTTNPGFCILPSQPAASLYWNAVRRIVSKEGEAIKMTPAEYNLLTFFVQNPDKPLTRDLILNSVWGYECFPNTRTVDAHVVKLRHKLEPDPAIPKHFLTLHGVGYRFLP